MAKQKSKTEIVERLAERIGGYEVVMKIAGGRGQVTLPLDSVSRDDLIFLLRNTEREQVAEQIFKQNEDGRIELNKDYCTLFGVATDGTRLFNRVSKENGGNLVGPGGQVRHSVPRFNGRERGM